MINHTEVTVRVVLSYDDEAPEFNRSDNDQVFTAQQAFIQGVPERLVTGVVIHHAEIIKGLVDKDGVLQDTRKSARRG